jgi:hypothetical protein
MGLGYFFLSFVFTHPFFYYFTKKIQTTMNDYWNSLYGKKEELIKREENEEKNPLPVIKYEDSYWELFHKVPNEYLFTEEEIQLQKKLVDSEKELLAKNKVEIKKKIQYLIEKSKKIDEFESDYEDELERIECKEEIREHLYSFKKKLEEIEHSLLDENEEKLQEKARNQIIEKRLEKLKNCVLMEKTPLGNVAMYYNSIKESFEYYSDSTIPYRFLEVVARKYVATYQCCPLYVIMEEELKKYEKKVEEQRRKQEEERKIELEVSHSKEGSTNYVPKKNVFAKFKSYNKEAGTGRVNKAPPPKNSIPNFARQNKNSGEEENIFLKEKANRYTYEGRFSHFSPLKKIDRKQVDKKYAMTFAEFKKFQKEQNMHKNV